jgi:hypothetical protein
MVRSVTKQKAAFCAVRSAVLDEVFFFIAPFTYINKLSDRDTHIITV